LQHVVCTVTTWKYTLWAATKQHFQVMNIPNILNMNIPDIFQETEFATELLLGE